MRTIHDLLKNLKGQTFGVTFIKRDGSIRKMTCQLKHNDGDRTKGGYWANGNAAGTPADHGIQVVTEIVMFEPIPQYRSFKYANVTEFRTGGKVYTLENEQITSVSNGK